MSSGARPSIEQRHVLPLALTSPEAATAAVAVPAETSVDPAFPATSVSLDPQQALVLLRSLADPLRLQVITALGQGERCVCDLTAELGLSQSRLSFHLKVMREAGLLHARQQGRWMYYRLRPEALELLGDWLKALQQACRRPAAECR